MVEFRAYIEDSKTAAIHEQLNSNAVDNNSKTETTI